MGDTRYFTCEPNKGLFIRASDIQRKLSPEELVQKIIQLSDNSWANPNTSGA